MVGLVVVSHSASIAAGVVELARQMGGDAVRIEPAGGMAEPEGAIGTDAEVVRAAIARAASPDGVLVLMDLGSAVMSAEMAAEMARMEDADLRVLLGDAPLVEGAVAAAALAGAGASLEEVAAEARGALRMKVDQLGGEEPPAAAAAAAAAPAAEGEEARLPVPNALGLHARPAALVVQLAGRFDARLTLADATTGKGPVDARSLTGVVTLGARWGHELVARATGPDAAAALAALAELAGEGYGDGVSPGGAPGADAGSRATGPGARPAGPAAAPPPAGPAAPPPAGARLVAVAASPGLAIGPARHPVAAGGHAAEAAAPAGSPDEEQGRLDAALAAAREDVAAARATVAARAGAAEAAIFDAHLVLLDDAALLDPARAAIGAGTPAPAAWREAVAGVAAAYRGLQDAYLAERAADVEDVGRRVSAHLAGGAAALAPTAPGILVAADVTPGEAALLDPAVVTGLALAAGGATSHAAILARGLGIPAVAGLGTGILGLADGTPLVLDGDAGTVEVDPPEDVLRERERARAAAVARRARARARAAEPATTRDGATIHVGANAGSAQDARAAVEHGADGVGLLRTEFLFQDRADAPGEEEQRAAYAEVAEALEGRPLTIRTLDAGADKPLRFVAQDPEANPFLGVRGLRLSLRRPDLLAAQLRAILAVGRDHPVRVMFPMVTTPAELAAARRHVAEARAAVGGGDVPVGVMVEVPALALGAGRVARDVDFFSIGTNDLTQYALAAERGNPATAELLAGAHPAVLRLVSLVVAGAAPGGRSVSVCGELAGDPAAAVLLAGLGVGALSVAAPRVPEVKQVLRDVALADARATALHALEADDAAAVAALVAPLTGA